MKLNRKKMSEDMFWLITIVYLTLGHNWLKTYWFQVYIIIIPYLYSEIITTVFNFSVVLFGWNINIS